MILKRCRSGKVIDVKSNKKYGIKKIQTDTKNWENNGENI